MTAIQAALSAPWLAWTALFAAVFAAVRHLLLSAGFWRPRAVNLPGGLAGFGQRRPLLFRMLMIPGRESGIRKMREQLLRGCGFSLDAGTYLLIRRMVLAASGGAAMLIYASPWPGRWLSPSLRILVLAALVMLIAALLADKPVLEVIMKRRRQRIVSDIYAISRQLLYTCGSPANLHGKLVRCLPYANAMREEWYLLTHEWYQSPATAIERFRRRIGTEEGHVFAETLNALRLNEHESYYELLRQRIDEYKEKLELLREGRRETVSYLLFVMAGIPILYTFRLFIFPWVAEGQKLFDSLG